ncbi:MAG: bacteriorhodopsin [Haloarculaceae archaeon]
MVLTTWFTLGLLGMIAGTAILAYGFTLIPESKYRLYGLLVAIPGIAVFAYALMALGIGGITVSGDPVYVPRYIDWLLTTPINVLYLGLFAAAARETIYRLIGLQAATIVFGFLGALLPNPINYLAFLVGAAAFAGVVYLLYEDIARSAEATLDDTELGFYETLRNFVVVLWLIYPIIWLLAQSGTGLMDFETTTLVVTYLDVVTKVGFGLIALHGLVVTTEVVVTDEDSVDESDPTPA